MAYHIDTYKLFLVKDAKVTLPKHTIDSDKTAADMLQRYLHGIDREHFVVLLLDTKHHVIGIHTVSIGNLNSSLVHPREVFKAAILGNAAAIILGHNHPSGDPTPSFEDKELTKRLKAAGELLGIPVLDHIVIGDDTHVSFQQMGLMA